MYELILLIEQSLLKKRKTIFPRQEDNFVAVLGRHFETKSGPIEIFDLTYGLSLKWGIKSSQYFIHSTPFKTNFLKSGHDPFPGSWTTFLPSLV